MELALYLGYSGKRLSLPMSLIEAADRLGYHSVWTAESYGSDSVTPLAYIAARTQCIRLGTAVMQMPARTPAMTAMTAISLDHLSQGRFLLGLGLSGPQVVEGWHGQPYGKPLVKTREYVSIVRQIFAREAPLTHHGDHYDIPYAGPTATGLGKPLKSIIEGRRDLPIYLAAIGPMNVALAAEIADGWLPIFVSPESLHDVFLPALEEGFAAAGNDKTLADFAVAPQVTVVMSDNLSLARDMVRPVLSLYIGGMGARGKNFYYDLAVRMGYADAAETIQTRYLSGDRPGAMAAVPDDLIDAVALVGPKARIRERLAAWQASPATMLNISLPLPDLATIEALAEMVL